MTRRSRIFHFVVAGILALTWIFHIPITKASGDWMAQRFGAQILSMGEGKIENASAFVQYRVKEALLLLTSLWLLALLLLWVIRTTRSIGAFLRWLYVSLAGFVGLNLLLEVARHGILFWAVMLAKAGVQNLSQLEIKYHLLAESSRPVRIALLGSSQMRAQVNEELLNANVNDHMRAFDLHYPGSQPGDMLAVWRKIRRTKPDIAVLYLSEACFYAPGDHQAVMVFQSFAGLSDWAQARSIYPTRAVAYGLLGRILPIFYIRDALGVRILGQTLFHLNQLQGQATLATDLAQRAAKLADHYREGTESDARFYLLERLISLCVAENTHVILIAGQLNPVLESRLPEGMRTAMLTRLEAMVAGRQGVDLWRPDPQSESDYEDLTHVGEKAMKRFTLALAEKLNSRLSPLHTAP